jgi:hypothetical protein
MHKKTPKRNGAKKSDLSEDEPTESYLGSWHANLIYIDRKKYFQIYLGLIWSVFLLLKVFPKKRKQKLCLNTHQLSIQTPTVKAY